MISAQTTPANVFGYSDFAPEAKIEQQFLAVPDAKLAGQHLKTLTAEPHMAATPEDHKTAEYVAEKFRAADSIQRLCLQSAAQLAQGGAL